MTSQEKEQLRKIALRLDSHIEEQKNLKCLIELVPEIQNLVREKQESMAANKRIAEISRTFMAVVAGIGTFIATMAAVAWLIVTLGNNPK